MQDKTSSSSEIIGSWLDITERKQIESALQESEQRYRLMFESSPHPMWVYDLRTLCFLAVNKTAVHCYGYSQEEFLAMSVRDILLYEDISLLEESSFITESFSSSGRWRHQKKDGTPIDVEITSGPLTFLGRPARVVLINDITEHKRIEKQLLHNAFHDALTALPNRVLFMNYLRDALERTKQCEDYQFAVFFLDLDRFKVINDSLGHLVGDELLLAVAHRLQQCLRPGDMVARLGGDEFTILLEDVKDLSCVNNVAERIHKQFSLPFLLGQREVHTSVSIGMVISVPGYEHPDDILRDADIAMYRAKSLGKGRSVIFSSQIDGYAVKQLSLEIELRQALQRGELRLHYQPIMDIATGRIAQIEALVRWEHPQRGLVPPSEFISLAEDSELILPIGRWVLEEACHQMQEWQRLYHVGPALAVCVNLSMRQFQLPDLVEQVAHLLHETGLAPACLVLEITETTTMKDADATIHTLHQPKELGVKLAIDDFGTGYSSLNHLWRFPVDTLKIDRSFVNNLGREPGVEKIVHAVTAIAHALGMSVVAEGIETAEQLTNVRMAGADYGQGYYFLKPCHSNEMTKLIRLEALLQHEATKLADEFVGTFSRQTVERLVYELLPKSLSAWTSAICPATLHCFVHEQLIALAQEQVQGRWQKHVPTILFVCVHNAGRSQMAAALTTALSQGRVQVHSAGSKPADRINPVASAVMAEIGIDLCDAFPKPLTDELVLSADVVVTMGCGDTCPVYPDKWYLDWKLADPAGRSVDEVRQIREEIQYHVEHLLLKLSEFQRYIAPSTDFDCT